MASYEGIPIPKIYEAQMPSAGGGWSILEKIVPTLANAYIRGMQNEELNQLRADTTMYSAIAESSKNYLEPEPIKGLIDSLTVERNKQVASGDTVRANYINASIASMQPWLLTREKQGDARDLINSMEKNMDAIENTPGYQGDALNLLNDMLENLNEYEPYFSNRMVTDINAQQSELDNRLSALSVLKDIDDNDMTVDEHGNPIDVPGIQVNRAKYPNEESYFKAKQAVDLLQISLQGKDVNKKLFNQGLSLHNQSLNEWGSATSEQDRQKKDLHGAAVGNIDRQLQALSNQFKVPKGKGSDYFLDQNIIDAGLIQDLHKQLNVTGTGVDAKTLKLIRNYALGNVAKVLENTDVPLSWINSDESAAFTEIKERVNMWSASGSPMSAQGDLLLNDIEDFLGYYKPDAKLSRENIGLLDFPGTGTQQTNASKLVLSYLDFLKSLEETSINLHDLWGWNRERETSNMYGSRQSKVAAFVGGNP